MKIHWFGLMLVLAGAVQAADTVHFTATVHGRLTIGPEGRVQDVQLENADWMEESVAEDYLRKIRGWRFKPVLESGKAVDATGRMRLRLAAIRHESTKAVELAIDQADFVDPDAPLLSAEGMGEHRPAYPKAAARVGVGAFVLLIARVDEQGVPTDLAVEYLHLTGPDPGANEQRLADEFERASVAVARRWRVTGAAAGDLVRLPVSYAPPEASGPSVGWKQVWPVSRPIPEWLARELAEGELVREMAGGPSISSSGLRLLRPLSTGPDI